MIAFFFCGAVRKDLFVKGPMWASAPTVLLFLWVRGPAVIVFPYEKGPGVRFAAVSYHERNVLTLKPASIRQSHDSTLQWAI